MAKSVRLKDIAEKLGVSTVTVSKALSGQKGMSEEVRKKIHALANEMGYIPSVSRKLENMNKNYTIGVIISEVYMGEYDAYYNRLHQQISQLAMEKGSFTMLEVISGDSIKRLTLPRIISDNKVDGILILGRLPGKYLENIRASSSIPVIYLDFYDHYISEDAVTCDSYSGACLMTEYLIGKGHSRIGFVGTVLATDSITDRYFGYRKALLLNNIEFRQDWVINDRDPDINVPDPDKFFNLPEEMPTAFICSSDIAAGMLIKKLSESGYSVPDDVSVVGYGNCSRSDISDKKVTTYAVDSYELGRSAVENLIRKIGRERYHHGVMTLDGNLIEGETVKAVM